MIAGGALIGAAGVYLLSRVPAGGSYVNDVLPGMLIMALGMGAVFVAATAAANTGVPPSQAGLTSGYQRGLFAGSLFMVAAAVIALRTSNTKVAAPPVIVCAEAAPEPAPSRSAGS